MTSALAEPRPWSRRRWWGMVGLVFGVQLALIFWLGETSPVRPRPPAPGLTLKLAGSASADLLALAIPRCSPCRTSRGCPCRRRCELRNRISILSRGRSRRTTHSWPLTSLAPPSTGSWRRTLLNSLPPAGQIPARADPARASSAGDFRRALDFAIGMGPGPPAAPDAARTALAGEPGYPDQQRGSDRGGRGGPADLRHVAFGQRFQVGGPTGPRASQRRAVRAAEP